MWYVIREFPGRDPEEVASSANYDYASKLVFAVAESCRGYSGTKVYLMEADSADQLQRTRNGKIVRDQPHLPKVGENVTILVPTATARGAAL